MQISTVLFGLVALSTSTFSTAAEPLPWDGRAQGLTVDKLTGKYITKILTQRDGESKGSPADYVTVKEKVRSPAYNGDTGVIDIGVNDKAVWGSEVYSRRSELVQNITTNSTGTTFFRASVLKNDTFYYPYSWKVIFPESQLFEIHVDARSDFPSILYKTNATKEAQWKTNFNLTPGDEDLVLNTTTKIASELPSSIEMHWGLLTQVKQSKTATGPVMTKKQEVLSFSGMSAESGVVTAATTSASKQAKSTTGTVAGEADEVHQTGQKSFTF
ncbi:hypothetical protein L917_05303 [Phytophthora nicotianae]|uniref:Glycoside hydrolase 131 catalytic N-terminal domain-containing protein n=3 Tax=Phytophthora nicotianae TaxID=4792 RepID=V9FKQ4_PHYNI|nr:hypothetical protein F443_05605 [Phytophthora nicotianae P1569]ETK90832.1 hypothetical protein L915_05470 [Phytophthora nicotianae]ETL44243.1 hypothetical protein L916_05415 [Phytophthora nicotianae]ETL97410.1 hypothetical protein L917_05303 [Phytophthora nicotianae]ETM50568.1 hypothetical protein L914_05422 [Phytophthora nicotianae]